MDRYTGDRPELLRLVTDTPRTALDVGCGAGAFAELLRSRGVERITGIEPDPTRSVEAATRVDRLLATTVEDALERLREIPPPKDQVHFVIDDDDDDDDEDLI